MRTVFRRSGIGGASIARLLDTSEFPSITWRLDCRLMTLLWLVTGASLVVALIALGQARRTADASISSRRMYWELKYQHGELRAQPAAAHWRLHARSRRRIPASQVPADRIRPACVVEAIRNQFLACANSYDVVVIGAGTGGTSPRSAARSSGKRVAVVEKQKALGGTCLIWGCIPTKALLEHAHALKVDS